MLLLPLLLACATEPAAPATADPIDDPVVAELEQSMKTEGAQVPWARSGQGSAPAAAPAAMAAAAELTPRQQADEVFNVAMQAYETGDAATAATALPLALRAYAMVPDLDLDGHFHVAVLQLSSGLPGDAMATADKVLAVYPTHLLALGVAARAAEAAGDTAAAAGYHERYLAAYGAELGVTEQYGHHQVLLPVYLEEAQQPGG